VYRISGIGVTRGWESLHNEVPGTEKPEGPKVPKVPKLKFQKPKKCRAERELRKPIGIEMSFVLVGISYKCCGLFMKFNGLTNFEFNCTVHVQSSTEVRTPVNQRRVWSGERCRLPLK
jgi:hypothetical protein